MAKRFFVDLPSEGVSESTFSIHANFATDLRANADPASISDMVFCHQNDACMATWPCQRQGQEALHFKVCIMIPPGPLRGNPGGR